MKKLILSAALCLILSAPALAEGLLRTTAQQAIVVDNTTGQVLFAKNADERMPTSSMSKAMTIYAVLEALKNESLYLTDTLLVSEKAWKKGGSKMFVEVDKRVKVEDLIRGVTVQSGNDATIVLAEALAGSEDKFAAAITAKAKELGMENSNFANASGWPDPNHYSTARDLAVLANAIITNFPEYYHYFSEKEFTYNNIKQRNRNPLLYRDIGADGLKTGHTEDGGYGLIGSGTHKDRRVTVVVNGLASEKARAQEAAKLLEWGLRRFEIKTLVDAGTPLASVDVAFGRKKQVNATVKNNLTLTVPLLLTGEITAEAMVKSPLIAPVQEGDEIGTLKINIPELEPLTFPLYAAETIEEKSSLSMIFEKIPYLMGKK